MPLPTLRPYQARIGRAVLESVLHRRGLTFSVEIARQGGKNELSALLEVFLLATHMHTGGDLVKCAPTFVPQVLISKRRLQDRLADAGLLRLVRSEGGHILRLGRARQVFLSCEPGTHIVGHTASLLLEVDEAQEVDAEKFTKEVRPMGAAHQVTTVLYGTPWDGNTLLEQMKALNQELERKDGIPRHFRVEWEEVARYNPAYAQYVEAERQRLGEDHPLFRTQYRLLPVAGGGGLFSRSLLALLEGDHPRLRAPQPGGIYVAGIDVGGEPWQAPEGPRPTPHDATVVSIGELDFSACDDLHPEPTVRIVEHYWWQGEAHHILVPRLVDLLKRVWRCRRVVVDATGIGAGLTSMLVKALGEGVVQPFVFTAPRKARLGFDLLAAVGAGRLKVYARDGSPECQEFWRQMEQAEAHYLPGGRMDFFVDARKGHDDFLMSTALLLEAGRYLPRVARGRVPEAVGVGR
ncbi:MAG: hypothetical protein NZ951_02505 [Dehalococcoidia bacterium]|nr:hypothetical protein [Dehalococcoidia bacterium]MDW8119831.1 hypothetical protein [Chloroflexota bacterium]